jgi:hypothetical protein
LLFFRRNGASAASFQRDHHSRESPAAQGKKVKMSAETVKMSSGKALALALYLNAKALRFFQRKHRWVLHGM